MTKTTVAIATKDIKAYIAGNINIYTTNLKYKVTSRVENGETVLDIEADGYGGLAAVALDLRRGPQGPALVASGKASPHASSSGAFRNSSPADAGA